MMLSHLFYPMYEDIHSPKNTKGADYCAQTENIITSILPRPGQAAGSAHLWEVQAEGRYEAQTPTHTMLTSRTIIRAAQLSLLPGVRPRSIYQVVSLGS
jgi:hypothetical protein